jgi:enoyl-CoA hydratase
MSTTIITKIINKSIFHVQINRPEVRNAVNRICANELKQVFLDFDANEELNVAVFSGSNNVFCSGADLKAVATGDKEQMNDVSQLGPMGPSCLRLTKPVISAIQGFAVAGGLELALWTDLRVVEEDAKMGVLCRRVGVPLIDGGTVRLPRLIGQSRALDLILTGRLIEGQEAKEFGLANRVVKKGTAIDEAIALAETISKFPQTCMRNDRRSVLEQWSYPNESDALWNELRLGQVVMSSGEAVSGASKFKDGVGRHGKMF